MKTTQPPLVGRTLLAATLATAALASLPLQAIEYEAGDTKVKLDATFSAGASWRVSDQAGYNIRSSAETPISYGNSGSGNDSNLNYTRGDIFSKVVKVTPELEITHGDYGAFFRAKAFYDFKMMDGDLRYYKNGINKKGLNNDVGRAADLLDAFVYGNFDLAKHPLTVRVGQQALGWGEAIFASGGIASINPADGNAARLPGAEIKEIILPTPMISLSFGFSDAVSVEGFFRPKDAWKQTVLPSCGSYFLPRDITGRASGRTYDDNSCSLLNIGSATVGAVLGTDAHGNPIGSDLFSAAAGSARAATFAAGLNGLSRPNTVRPGQPWTATDVAKLLYIPRDPDIEPEKNEYGIALRFILPTEYEMALFYTKTNATTGTIYGRPTTGGPNSLTALGLPVPFGNLNTGSYGFYFPEGIDSYGISFNGNSWGSAWQGELVYRPNNPLNYAEPAMVQSNILGFSGLPNLVFIDGPNGRILNMTEEAETWQASTAMTRVLNPTALWDSGSVLVEVIGNYAALNNDAVVIRTATPVRRHDDVNEFAWGYRARLGLNYFNVSPLGLTLGPSILWSHDVNGVNRSGVGTGMKEGNQVLTLGLETKYLTKHTVTVSYSNFFHSKAYADNLSDRDFVSLNYIYSL